MLLRVRIRWTDARTHAILDGGKKLNTNVDVRSRSYLVVWMRFWGNSHCVSRCAHASASPKANDKHTRSKRASIDLSVLGHPSSLPLLPFNNLLAPSCTLAGCTYTHVFCVLLFPFRPARPGPTLRVSIGSSSCLLHLFFYIRHTFYSSSLSLSLSHSPSSRAGSAGEREPAQARRCCRTRRRKKNNGR